MIVHAGGVIRLLAYVSGQPQPVITWDRDQGSVPAEAVVETTAISCSLVIKECNRKQQGVYTITAKNDGGEVKRSVIVDVLGKYCKITYALYVNLKLYDNVSFLFAQMSPAQWGLRSLQRI